MVRDSDLEEIPSGSPSFLAVDHQPEIVADGHDERDLSEMLEELRILLPGAQILTAFLVTLPFMSGFGKMQQPEKWIFLATFLCSITSLIFFSAPAAIHRQERPLHNRVSFKLFATKLILAGVLFSSLALTLGSGLVIAEALGRPMGIAAGALVGTAILVLWWILPWLRKARHLD